MCFQKEQCLEYILATADAELLIDLKLNRETMAVPTKAPRNMMTCLVRVPTDDVLDRTGEKVTIVRQSGGKWWAIVEGEDGAPL